VTRVLLWATRPSPTNSLQDLHHLSELKAMFNRDMGRAG
jgi:hypothetical protein